MTRKSNKRNKSTGPKPDHLKIDGNWIDAVNKAVKKKRPKSEEAMHAVIEGYNSGNMQKLPRFYPKWASYEA